MPEQEFKFPPVSKELLDHLDKLYPDRCPDASTGERELWVRVGEVRVVRKLKQAYEIQNKRVISVQQQSPRP